MTGAPTNKRIFEKTSTINKWDEDYYHPIALKLFDKAIADMLQVMDAPHGATVLDAGCGPGVHSIRVARSGYEVHAVDISETMLRHAQTRAEEAGMLDRIRFSIEDLTHLSFESNSYDYVFSWGVIIHIPDAERALLELSRILRPRGKLALFIVNKTAIDNKVEAIARLVTRKPLNIEDRELGDRILYKMAGEDLWVWRFDMKKVSKVLEGQGMKLISRRTGEFTEIQRRISGPLRSALLHFNNFAYEHRFPPGASCTNLLVFEKSNA